MIRKSIEVWGGIECTINRVGDTYFDQVSMNGHYIRTNDLKMFADLGIRTLRFPLLWERLAPDSLEKINWTWSDEQLALAKDLGIRIIAGLVHHGSGPRYTNLLDPEFPFKLADYARRIADRYPWIEAYTPINEPLTTARFSGLYGFWYPHARDPKLFMRMLINQCRGIIEAMKAIRSINASAQLIQTEDMGKVFSTALLDYQAQFENERRWLSFDLLTNRLDNDHPLWNWCLGTGVSERELLNFLEVPCQPSILGINHYITSNRMLDERLERYPAASHGGNGRHRYADIEAVRVGAEPIFGHTEIIQEVWNRYHQPIAITEVHMGSTRDEQLRWLDESYQSADSLIQEGVDLRAITVWSLLGTFDWDSLVTKVNGYYEPGVFDVRDGKLRPTALAQMVKRLTNGETYDHPTLDSNGWWHRSERFHYPPVPTVPNRQMKSLTPKQNTTPRELIITGGRGTLARAFANLCQERSLPFRLLERQHLDIANAEAARRIIALTNPWAVINAAGYCKVDEAELDPATCFRENVIGPAILAEICAERKIPLLTFSTDLVFSGDREDPYTESQKPSPLNVYGEAKAKAEAEVLARHDNCLVIRTSAFFGPWDEHNFLIVSLRRLAQGLNVPAASNKVSPTYIPDLVHAALDLLIDGERGIWHLTNRGETSWAEFARMAAKRGGISDHGIIEVSTDELRFAARRPAYSALASERAMLLPRLDCAIHRFTRNCCVAFQ